MQLLSSYIYVKLWLTSCICLPFLKAAGLPRALLACPMAAHGFGKLIGGCGALFFLHFSLHPLAEDEEHQSACGTGTGIFIED